MCHKQPSPDEILEEIGFSNYITNPKQLKRVTMACRDLLEKQQKSPHDRAAHINSALEFSRALWAKYDCEQVADLYSKFQRIEEGLFGLERNEATGTRYRDHFVHMFNCYLFGLRLMTPLLNRLGDGAAPAAFKVKDEKLKELGLPFGENYTYKKRLFYLWTLIATFHDIAIPFQHLRKIGSGINQFVQEFGWEFTDPQVNMRSYDASQLYHYFDLLGRVYGSGLVLDEDGVRYQRQTNPHHYLARILGREFDGNDHGVLSGFFMWKTIEEIFLTGNTSKYKLTMEQFNTYVDCVLEQDIARAALAISLHNLRPHSANNRLPHVFPVRYSDFPLTFLLLLTDGLQEYLRWEGTTVSGETRFGNHPGVSVELGNKGAVPQTKVVYSWDNADADKVITQAKAVANHEGWFDGIDNLSDAADIIGKSMKKSLESRLMIGADFKLSVEIRIDWDQVVYAKEFCTGSA